ncbi:MAG: hypothetical protein JSU08_08465 [Acidobacteria bacterium]|nr:hypothetical protein [Acidobacteriota bacterium]
MWKRLRIVLLAVIAAAVVVPVGFALESSRRATAPVQIEPVAQVLVTRPQGVAHAAAPTMFPDVPEGAKLLGIGTVLFGLAAAMRRGRRSDT